MKIIPVLLSFFLLFSCTGRTETTYNGSTPVGITVRSFLAIPLSDSVDFARWKLILRDGRYELHCNYGIGKNNTNGFINDGKQIKISGALKKEGSHYLLMNADKILRIAELNGDLLHLLDENNRLLVGNGGWSYTLNNTRPAGTDELNAGSVQKKWKDSIVFEGRTPCGVPGIIPAGQECYKLKWKIIFYGDAENNGAGSYLIKGTALRKEGTSKGTWKISTTKNGHSLYQLNDKKGNGMLYLLKADEDILLFAHENGKLLVGNEDFSYTLNRKL